MFRSCPVRTRKRGFFEDRLPDSKAARTHQITVKYVAFLWGKKFVFCERETE